MLVISEELRQRITTSSESKGKTLKSLLLTAVMNEDRESLRTGLLDFFLACY